jgi:hypothetical protein
LVVVAVLVLGWLNRDLVISEGRKLLDRIAAPSAAPTSPAAPATSGKPRGRPGVRSLATARAKIDSLNGWRADSVVLTSAEVASLFGSELDPEFRKELDSLQVELLDGEVKARARLRTDKLPRDVVGPFAAVLGPNEPVEAVGPLRVTGPGKGEWAVRSFRIRDFPVPSAAVPEIVSRALGTPGRKTVPWKVPAGVRDVRVYPGGATLYGASRP